MDKKGFRIHNVQTDRSLPWERYTETATGIIKTSHEIWLRRTQWVFHIGGYKKKHSREVSFSQKMGKESLVLKASAGKQTHYMRIYLGRMAV